MGIIKSLLEIVIRIVIRKKESLLIMIFSTANNDFSTVNNDFPTVNNDFCHTFSGLGQHIEPQTRIRTAPLTTRQ